MAKMKKSLSMLTGTMLSLCAMATQAATVSINTSYDSDRRAHDADIVISGLGAGSAPSLGAYDLDFHYDRDAYSFNSARFGDAGLGNQLDIGGYGTLRGSRDNGRGSVNLYEVSLDDAPLLNSRQASRFVLASLEFDELGTAKTPFSITFNAVGDAGGNPIVVSTHNGGDNVNVVPLPASVWLMGSALLGLFGLGRRKRSS